jgi:hypothetical protein
MSDDGSKRCRACGELKPLAEFHKDASASDGFNNRCKECQKLYRRQWSSDLDKKERIREYTKKWLGLHPEAALRYREKQRTQREQARSQEEPSQFHSGDIRFSCQHCQQSMVIERRGAGLAVECPSCHETTRVPETKGLNRNRACLVHWLEDAAMVLERGIKTSITGTRNGLQRRLNLVEPEETALVDSAIVWLNEQLRAIHDLDDPEDFWKIKTTPNPELAKGLSSLARELRTRWGITDEMLKDWKPRTFSQRQECEAIINTLATPSPLPRGSAEQNWRAELPTWRQLRYLKKLGYIPQPGQPLTRGEASDLINKLMPEEDRQSFEESETPTALVVDLSDLTPEPLDLSGLRVKELDELQPPEEWKFQPADKKLLLLLEMNGVTTSEPLTAGQASDLLAQISEARDRQRWERADESTRQRILRDKCLASYLRADYEKAKQTLAAAKECNDEAGIDEAELDLELAEEDRLNFWRSTFDENGYDAGNQTFDLYYSHGFRFKIPTQNQIESILEALDAASATWDRESPELFYEVLELNFPEQRRKEKAGG